MINILKIEGGRPLAPEAVFYCGVVMIGYIIYLIFREYKFRKMMRGDSND